MKYCSKCGNNTDDHVDMCHSCGSLLFQPNYPNLVRRNNFKKTTRIIVVLSISLLVVITFLIIHLNNFDEIDKMLNNADLFLNKNLGEIHKQLASDDEKIFFKAMRELSKFITSLEELHNHQKDMSIKQSKKYQLIIADVQKKIYDELLTDYYSSSQEKIEKILNQLSFPFSFDYKSIKDYLGNEISIFTSDYPNAEINPDAANMLSNLIKDHIREEISREVEVYSVDFDVDGITHVIFCTASNNLITCISILVFLDNNYGAELLFSRIKRNNQMPSSGILVANSNNIYKWKIGNEPVMVTTVDITEYSELGFIIVSLLYLME